MTIALLDFLIYLSGTLVLVILVARSIHQANEIEKLHEADKRIKEDFADEWTKCIMGDVNSKIASLKLTSEQKRAKNGRFAKSGESKPASL